MTNTNFQDLDTNIKVMYVNPVSTSDYDQVFADMIKAYKYPFTDAYVTSLNPATVPEKITNLEYRTYETFTELDTLKAARYCATNNFDSMVIGCFYDPTLQASREISGKCTVVAPCQSSCQIAAEISNKFSIIIGQYKWEDQMRQTVYDYGYKDQLASFQAVGLSVEEFQKDPAKTKELLHEACLEAIGLYRAEAIVLGCTLEIGFYTDLMEQLEKDIGVHVPVIDPSIAAFKAAENAAIRAKIGWYNSKLYGMTPPSEVQLKEFGILQEEYKFGNMIHIGPSV